MLSYHSFHKYLYMTPTIESECSQFLKESKQLPLYKMLPRKYDGFTKVKVRYQKNLADIDKLFFEYYKTERNLFTKCIITNGVQNICEEREKFYIFPINGYKFLYNTQIGDYQSTYTEMLNVLHNNIEPSAVNSIIHDHFKTTYTSSNLACGIETGCQIILYGIPYYYAIRASIIEDYSNFLK